MSVGPFLQFSSVCRWCYLRLDIIYKCSGVLHRQTDFAGMKVSDEFIVVRVVQNKVSDHKARLDVSYLCMNYCIDTV